MQRPSRTRESKGARARREALDKQRRMRELGLRNADLDESSDEEDADDADELKGKEDLGDFVVDDDGTGYKDYGDDDGDDDDAEDAQGDAKDEGNARRKGGKAKHKAELDAQDAKGTSQKLTTMFSKMGRRANAVGPGGASSAPSASEEAAERAVRGENSLMDSIVSDLMQSASSSTKKRKKGRDKKLRRSKKKRRQQSGLRRSREVDADSDPEDSRAYLGHGADDDGDDFMNDDDDDDVVDDAAKPALPAVDKKYAAEDDDDEEEEETLVGAAASVKKETEDAGAAMETNGADDVTPREEEAKEKEEEEKPKPKGKAALLAAARKKPVRSAPKAVAPSTPPPAADRGVTFMSTPPAMMGKDDDSSGWSSTNAVALGDGGTAASATSSAPMDGSIMDELSEKDGQKYIDLFWLDIYENYYTMKGRLHLFGKTWCKRTKQFVSCYVEVRNMERALFVLPRDKYVDEDEGVTKDVEFHDVFSEMQKVVGKVLPVDREAGRSFKVRKTLLKYAFELPGVPREPTEYLEVRYPMCAEKDRLPFDIEGKTFSRIFGTHQTAVEQLLLARDLMGPCWIRVYGVQCPTERVPSWCRYNFYVEDDKAIHPLKDVLVREAEAAAAEEGEAANEESGAGSTAIKLPPPPPLRVLSLSLKTKVDPKSHEHQIMVVSGLLRDKVDVVSETAGHGDQSLARAFTIVRGDNGGSGFPAGFKEAAKARKQISVQSSERALLSYLMVQMHRFDPDMIVGHNIRNFEMDVLLSRLSKLNVGLMWSKMGRLKMSRMPGRRPGGGFYSSANLTPGRLMLDTYTTARELLLGQRSYTLQELCRTQLNTERHEVTPLQVPQYYQDKEWLLKLVQRNEVDAWLALSLMFKLEAVPLTLQLSNLGGNLWSRTLAGGRAERIEHLLLHEFSRQGYLLPDKVYADHGEGGAKGKNKGGKGAKGPAAAASRSAMRKPKYDGGLVLDPKVGLYDKYILLLDFNSLYPSIIQEYNICYTTVERARGGGLEDLDAAAAAAAEPLAGEDDMELGDDGEAGMDADVDTDDPNAIPGLPDRAKFPDLAILPSLIKTLVDRRRLVKQALKSERDPSKRKQLDVRQKALKLTANSMYGCLGFKGFRFFARPVAALVTSQGRSILQNTVNIAQDKLGLDVVYGDTDSIMINTGTTDLEAVNRIGQRVKSEINKLYNLLEIEQDGVFKTMLLLKKKKYAALAIKEVKGPNGEKQIVEEKETKGLDLVRRDWCQLSKDIGHAVLDHVLSGKPYDEVVEGILKCLDEVHEELEARKVGLEKFVITKGLNKNPRDYPDVKSQPHLQVALAMIARNKPVSVGDHIPYVICTMTRQQYEAKARERKEQQAVKKEGDADDAENEEPAPRTPAAASNASYAQRAFHPEEVTNDPWKLLQLDVDWYLKQQVVPPTRRLCEPIEGLTPGQIAEHLGLDPSAVQGGGAHHGDGHGDEDLLNIVDMPDADRFKSCERVALTCEKCELEHPFLGVVALPQDLAKIVPEKQQQSRVAQSGLQCPRCDHAVDLTDLTNQLHLAARRAVKKYYEGWLLADDPSADLRTRQQSVVGRSFTLHGRRVQLVPEYRPSMLYTQLRYLESLVNVPHALENLKKHYSSGNSKVDPPAPLSLQEAEALAEVQTSLANRYLNRSAYNWVQPDLFQRAFRLA